jgi:Gas vesicle synthesis protein GvpO
MAQSKRRSSGSNSRNGSVKPAEQARAAHKQLAELTGRPVESVLGLRKDDDGWKVTLEVVELSRIPNSTDLLGCYVVTLDDEGELLGYERVRRYQRGQAGGEQ